MPKAKRPHYIVGNWKMYKTIDEAVHFIDTIRPALSTGGSTVMLAVPFTIISTLAVNAKEIGIVIGAQNMNDSMEGAFTGEIAARMLKDAGAEFVLLGHSERRKMFAETDEFINRKIKRAFQSNLQPILCIGETFDEHEEKKTDEVLTRQLENCLAGIAKSQFSSLIIAYEPVWAIGTGIALDAAYAGTAAKRIRAILSTMMEPKEAEIIPVLYGGSVNVENCESFLMNPDLSGLLIGYASLHPETFAKIIELGQNIGK